MKYFGTISLGAKVILLLDENLSSFMPRTILRFIELATALF
jgi:hypothetical protein